MEIPVFQLKAQGGSWRCTITALEYVTEIDRDKIAEGVGHDGGGYSDFTKQKIASNELTQNSLSFVGVSFDEAAIWAQSAGYRIEHYITEEFIQDQKIHNQNTATDNKIITTYPKLLSTIKERIGIIGIPLCRKNNLWHTVAWFGYFICDPSDGYSKALKSGYISEAIMFESVLLKKRLQKLGVICEQGQPFLGAE